MCATCLNLKREEVATRQALGQAETAHTTAAANVWRQASRVYHLKDALDDIQTQLDALTQKHEGEHE